ncbi:MAG: hypothetical protein WCV71_03805 [Patescibacteria group bacterium]
MINLERLFIKDEKNNLFKIFIVLSQSDGRGEPYIKICFPKNKLGGKLYDIDKTSQIVDNYYEQFKYENKNLEEFSYHYVAGLSHFKNKNIHALKLKKLPTIKPEKFIKPFLLLKIIIFNLENIKINTKKLEKNDFIVPHIFNHKNGRILHLYLNKKEDNIIYSKQDDSDGELVNHINNYEFIDSDYDIKLTITDHEFKNKPLNKGIDFHRPLDPKIKAYIKIDEKNFKEEFLFIQNLFMNNVPSELIDGGAPHDEYDSYIHQFISTFKSFSTENDIYNYLNNIYLDGFNKNNAKIIAKEIWERYFDI